MRVVTGRATAPVAAGRVAAGWLAIAATFVLSGCAWSASDSGESDVGDRSLPQVGADFDYQLGGDYQPAPGVEVVVRDSSGAPEPGLYNICYVNGFQTQPDEGESWLADNPDLVLHDADGTPVIDPGWPDEYLLDTSTESKRAAIESRLAPVLSTCADKGFDAIEIDNLDSWYRSNGALLMEDNLALVKQYAEYAHSLGLAIAQKNGAGFSQEFRNEVGFDFAVVEECGRYFECRDYLDAYDGLVFDIEYPEDGLPTDTDFLAGCGGPDLPLSMILRDLDLTKPGSAGYRRVSCAD